MEKTCCNLSELVDSDKSEITLTSVFISFNILLIILDIFSPNEYN